MTMRGPEAGMLLCTGHVNGHGSLKEVGALAGCIRGGVMAPLIWVRLQPSPLLLALPAALPLDAGPVALICRADKVMYLSHTAALQCECDCHLITLAGTITSGGGLLTPVQQQAGSPMDGVREVSVSCMTLAILVARRCKIAGVPLPCGQSLNKQCWQVCA